jgi:hypothetical protein
MESKESKALTEVLKPMRPMDEEEMKIFGTKKVKTIRLSHKPPPKAKKPQ